MESDIKNNTNVSHRYDMNHRSPRVTVLMPVFNGERYLREAIESILNQTFTDFEFLIIDDGSSDRSVEIIRSYDDPRIRLVINEERVGLVASLNQGLALACGEYIARMDGDDISLPERLAKQVEFLDKYSDTGVLGTDIELIDESGTPLLDSKPPLPSTLPGVVRWALFFRCCVNHPTVMVRRTVYERLNGYNPAFPHAEDYELWLRASLETKITNLPDVLVRLRQHLGGLTKTYVEAVRQYSEIAVRNAVSTNLGREVSLERVRAIQNPHYMQSPEDAFETASLIYDLQHLCTNASNTSLSERSQIRADTTRRLWMLAMVCANRNPVVSIRILRLGFLLHPKQLFQLVFSVPTRQLRGLVHRLWAVRN